MLSFKLLLCLVVWFSLFTVVRVPFFPFFSMLLVMLSYLKYPYITQYILAICLISLHVISNCSCKEILSTYEDIVLVFAHLPCSICYFLFFHPYVSHVFIFHFLHVFFPSLFPFFVVGGWSVSWIVTETGSQDNSYTGLL